MRPRLLEQSPEVGERIIQAMRAGNYLETAASFAGVTPRLARLWLRKGAAANRRLEQGLPYDERDRVYLHFWQAVEEARAQAEVRDVARIVQAGEKDWRAAAWRLQHRHPDRWGRETLRVEHDIGEDAAARGADLVRRLRGDAETRHALDLLARSLEGDAGEHGGEDEPGALEAGEAPGADLGSGGEGGE